MVSFLEKKLIYYKTEEDSIRLRFYPKLREISQRS